MRNVLSQKNRFTLWNFVQKEYTASGMNDKDFAAKATKELGFETGQHHVEQARDGLEIPNNLRAISEMSPAVLVARVQALEAAMQGLYRHLGWTPTEQRGVGHG